MDIDNSDLQPTNVDAVLRQKEEQLRLFIASSSSIVYKMNADWTRMERLVGKEMLADTPEPIMGWMDKYILPEDQSFVNSIIQQAIKTQSNFDLKHRVINAGGSVGWIHSRAIPLFNAQAIICGLFGSGTDITKQVETESALRISEEQLHTKLEELKHRTKELDDQRAILQATINSSMDIIQVLKAVRNDDGEIVDFVWQLNNKAAVKMYGDVIGKSLRSNVSPMGETGTWEMFKAVVESGRPEKIEKHYVHEHIEGWYIQSTVKQDDGVATTITDITSRKQADQEIIRLKDEIAQQATNKYHTLFNSIDTGFVIIELLFDEQYIATDFLFLEANPAFVKQSSLEGAINQTMKSLVPEHEDFWFDTYGEIAKTGEARRFEHFASHVAGGSWYDVYAFRTGEPNAHQVAVLFNDITQRKALEKHKDDFISVASHELKTPVTTIKVYSEALQDFSDGDGSVVTREMVKRMNSQIDRLSDLINTLLDTSSISDGLLKLHEQYFDINDLIQEQVEEVQQISSNHEFIVDMYPVPAVQADRERISQVLTNLLSNAVKYSPKGGKVYVGCNMIQKHIQISVQDNGVGIPKEMHSKVFDRFFRVPDIRLRNYPGMGLGLYITAEIIQRHVGKIWVESEPGKGSTFYFTLPLKE